MTTKYICPIGQGTVCVDGTLARGNDLKMPCRFWSLEKGDCRFVLACDRLIEAPRKQEVKNASNSK